ncbi:MAG TPA: hypothetical protein PK402_12110 [Tepidisphaeraceae bacterium]|nr:hypothetical protein [Tepidisphaeraceae bacterium]
MAFISVSCDCGKSFKVESTRAGKKIRCACGKILTVADASESPAPEPIDVGETNVAPKRAGRLPNRSELDTQSYQAANKSNAMKFAILGVGLVVLCFAIVLVAMRAKGPPVVHKGHDAEAISYIRDAAEAREWLKGRDMMLGGMSHKQADFKINQWYEMGVKTIYIKGRPAMFVVMELPEDPAKRKTIFEWHTKFVGKSNESPAIDEGQKYLMVKMPLGDVN